MIDFYNLQVSNKHSEVDMADAIALPEGNYHSLLVLRNNITVVMVMNETNNEGKEVNLACFCSG